MTAVVIATITNNSTLTNAVTLKTIDRRPRGVLLALSGLIPQLQWSGTPENIPCERPIEGVPWSGSAVSAQERRPVNKRLGMTEVNRGFRGELARFPAIDGESRSQPALIDNLRLFRNGEQMAVFRLALSSGQISGSRSPWRPLRTGTRVVRRLVPFNPCPGTGPSFPKRFFEVLVECHEPTFFMFEHGFLVRKAGVCEP